MAGRALLIAAWVLVAGGIAGGAGYLHSLGPVSGPPDLSRPEAAPEPEAPPRLEAPPEPPAGEIAGHEPPAGEIGAYGPEPEAPLQGDNGHDAEPAATADEEPPRLPPLAETAGGAAGAATAAPPAVESLPALGGPSAEAPEPSETGERVLPTLAELAAAPEGTAERFQPETAWPVTTPELHGPMPMAERPAIDLALLAGQGRDAALEPEHLEPAPPPAAAWSAHPPAPDAPAIVPPTAEVAALPAAHETAEPEVVAAPEDHGDEGPAAAPEPATLLEAPAVPVETAVAETHEEPAVAVDETPAAPEALVHEPPAEAPHEPPVETPDETPGQELAVLTPPLAEVPPASVAPPPVEVPTAVVPGNGPVVGVVVVGLGLSSGATEAAIQSLPAAVTLSFSPYSGRLSDWVALARAAGHEVLIDLPMEPDDFPNSDPGPQALMTGLPADTNLERLDWVLSRTDNYVGVGSFMGSRFAADASAMRPVLQAIADRGLIYLDTGQAVGSVARSLGAEIGLSMLVSDGQVDSMAARQAIDAELAQIEALAKENGAALAVGTAYPVTIERLAVWTRSLADRGIVLAPASTLVGR